MSNIRQPSEMPFEIRPTGYGPFLISDSLGNILPGTEIEIGDSITLRIESVMVICTVTSKSNESYCGQVTGFEGFPGLDFNGLTPESIVKFSDRQIFGCTKRT